MSITISITIPEQLEEDLRNTAESIGISRSRFIGNILLDWQKQNTTPINDCVFQDNGTCEHFKFVCKAPQHSAETCEKYKSLKG